MSDEMGDTALDLAHAMGHCEVEALLRQHGGAEHIQFQVQGHFTDSVQNSVVHFKIKETTRLDKLLQAYCVRQNLGMQEVNFYYNGGRVMQDDTAQKLKMEEYEVIEAMPAESVLKDYQERVLMQRPPSAYFIFSDEKRKEVRAVLSVARQAPHARSLTCAAARELARRARRFLRVATCPRASGWLNSGDTTVVYLLPLCQAKEANAEKPLSAKELGEMWKALSEEDKAPLNVKAAELKAAYDANKRLCRSLDRRHRWLSASGSHQLCG